MRVAFYAPLKPPDHPVPSGDRRMGRLLRQALAAAGHETFIASRFRSREGSGDPAEQEQLRHRGEALARRIIESARSDPSHRPDLWFTYHLYYKAPDWLGPRVADALGIPYVVAEASVAEKRRDGPWATGHRAVTEALGQAETVIGLNQADREGVLPYLSDPARWVPLKPFLDLAPYERLPRPKQPGIPVLVAAAMMRPGDKLASYRLLGEALTRLRDRPWRLLVAGEGPARGEVEATLAPIRDRVTWLGEVVSRDMPQTLASADLCVWPAINEAWGMALLEAQACGVPVVAGDVGGVGEVVADGVSGLLTPAGDAEVFARAVAALLDNPDRRRRMGEAARERAQAQHGLAAAARTLGPALSRLARPRAA